MPSYLPNTHLLLSSPYWLTGVPHVHQPVCFPLYVSVSSYRLPLSPPTQLLLPFSTNSCPPQDQHSHVPTVICVNFQFLHINCPQQRAVNAVSNMRGPVFVAEAGGRQTGDD